jgi:hypothetical protein
MVQRRLPVFQVARGRHPIARLAFRAAKVAVVEQQGRDAALGEGLGKRVDAHVLLAGYAMRRYNDWWALCQSLSLAFAHARLGNHISFG